MTQYLPSTQVYSLDEIDVNLRNIIINFNNALLDQLHNSTLSEIKNAFHSAVIVANYGGIFIKVSDLGKLLRTGGSGAANYMWQQGISGFSSPAAPYTFGQDIYITGPDFLGLVEARISTSFGKSNVYLKYVRALYLALSSHEVFHDLRTLFASNVDQQRSDLKTRRIVHYQIEHCEFTGQRFSSPSDVQFAHIDSVVTAPLEALNINNGVIILKDIHSDLTELKIHDFAGMYDYCQEKNYSTAWVDTYYR